MPHPPLSPPPSDSPSTVADARHLRQWPITELSVGIGVGVLVTFIAVLGSLLTFSPHGGGGGGGGVLRAFFPIPIMSLQYVEWPAALALGLLQFPAYGATIGYCSTKGRMPLLIAIGYLAVPHALAILVEML